MMDLDQFKQAVNNAMQVQMLGCGTVQEQFSVQGELLCALRKLCDDMFHGRHK